MVTYKGSLFEDEKKEFFCISCSSQIEEIEDCYTDNGVIPSHSETILCEFCYLQLGHPKELK